MNYTLEQLKKLDPLAISGASSKHIQSVLTDVIATAISIMEAAEVKKDPLSLPEKLDWNQQMRAIKALLSCTDGELECIDEKLLNSYSGDVDRVFAYVRTLAAPQAAQPALQGYVLMPLKATHAITKAMAESRSVDDEGEFPLMLDLLDFSGENKMHTVLAAAYEAAVQSSGVQS